MNHYAYIYSIKYTEGIMVNREKIAQMLKAEVKRIGLRPLARAMKLAAPSIYNLTEMCVNPSTSTLDKLAVYFRIRLLSSMALL